MTLLALGILVFFLTHIIPTVPVLRGRLVNGIGVMPYKAVFSLLSAVGVGLIIYGFSQAPPLRGYDTPAWGVYVPLVAMPLAFILLVAAYVPCTIKRVTRHPMTLGVLLWSGSHLLASSDAPSGLLFGSFALYSVMNLLGQVSRPQPPRPAPQPRWKDILVIVIGLGLTVVMIGAHHILFGVSSMPYLFGAEAPLVPGG
ncbi:NnrU family protein [Roseospira marina]|uniref:NnrU family protein n=1 Tax=Roseospira marina TaxID=140057 RepID=A0A5M6I5K6_9PROT|nr:NnrU family protein [Roseospira marina]KAA5603511.1 NnrU family protein [Roseospira marina]MBB4315065.1 putative membrane protein [Roseospira marina]MBB5088165.1 putative membrane protein [Roseospira marina]